MNTDKIKVKIFYSYSHKDEELRECFESHMSGIKRKGLIEEWHDRKILPGQLWEQSISNNIEEADIVLFLVSSDFLASDYCYDKEVIKSVERHYNGHCVVVPIIIRDCDWDGTPFESIQGLPTDMKPVISRYWHNKDEAFTDIVKGLKKIIKNKFEDINSGTRKKPDVFFGDKSLSALMTITIRDLTSGKETTIQLRHDLEVKDFIQALKDEGILNNQNEYYLKVKKTGIELNPEKGFVENEVKDNDTLLVGIKTYAG